MIEYTTIFRVRVDLGFDDYDAIADSAFINAPNSVNASGFDGCAACCPYIEGESENLDDLKDWVKSFHV